MASGRPLTACSEGTEVPDPDILGCGIATLLCAAKGNKPTIRLSTGRGTSNAAIATMSG